MLARIAEWLAACKSFRGSHEARVGSARSYRCVSVLPCSRACNAVRRLATTRFLPEQAPRLPLPGCVLSSQDASTCVYRHHSDRRHANRREAFACGVVTCAQSFGECRTGGGRRIGDDGG